VDIEFFTPHGEVREAPINYVRELLVEFHKANKKISRAEVHFRSQDGDNICEIELMKNGDSLFVQRKASTYDQAAREAIKELQAQMHQ
jgi:hypothetical protein